jgi:hypothetical protein
MNFHWLIKKTKKKMQGLAYNICYAGNYIIYYMTFKTRSGITTFVVDLCIHRYMFSVASFSLLYDFWMLIEHNLSKLVLK